MGLRTRLAELGFVPYKLNALPNQITGIFIIPEKRIWLEQDVRHLTVDSHIFRKYRLYSRNPAIPYLYIRGDTVKECLDKYELQLKHMKL